MTAYIVLAREDHAGEATDAPLYRRAGDWIEARSKEEAVRHFRRSDHDYADREIAVIPAVNFAVYAGRSA